MSEPLPERSPARWGFRRASPRGRAGASGGDGGRQAPLALPPTPQLRLLGPVSSIDGGFFRSAGFYVRLSVLAGIALAALAVLAARLWSLQVLQQPRYEQLAERQAARVVDEPAPRGSIRDAKGRFLARTQGRLVLTANPSALGKIVPDEPWRPSRRGRAVLARLAGVSGVRLAELVRLIRESVARTPYAPVELLPRLSRPLAFYVEERQRGFPGLRVDTVPVRQYPQGALGSEFLGLLGEIDSKQLKQRAYRGYRPRMVIGRSGIEAAYDGILNGGFVRAGLSVDAAGRQAGPLRALGATRHPRDLQLTIDARLQRAAERAILDGISFAHEAGHPDANAGAAVVMNPRTGAVYALASYPSFNESAAASNASYLARLVDPRNEGALVNRATQGLYPLGSSFKPIVAEAALATGLIAPSTAVPCTGSFTVGNHVFHNIEAGANAMLTLPQALSISCDTWFYRLGAWFYERGSVAMQEWATRLGVGRATGIDLPGESAGLVPTPAWLRRTFSAPWQRIWYEGYSVNLSIGQGQLLATPLQLAVAYSALANGGTIVRPHVARAVLSPSGRVLRRLRFPPRRHVDLVDVQSIRDGLYMAAHEGTSAAVFGDFPVPVAGKTGTAETPFGSDHSWYASWAPAGHPRLVVVVLIEHGGFGAQAAAPAAREIYTAFFGLDRRRNHVRDR